MKHITEVERRGMEKALDGWARQGLLLEFDAARFQDARTLILRHHSLRAADALHLALVAWHGLELATLDRVLREAAIAEGLAVVDL